MSEPSGSVFTINASLWIDGEWESVAAALEHLKSLNIAPPFSASIHEKDGLAVLAVHAINTQTMWVANVYSDAADQIAAALTGEEI